MVCSMFEFKHNICSFWCANKLIEKYIFNFDEIQFSPIVIAEQTMSSTTLSQYSILLLICSEHISLSFDFYLDKCIPWWLFGIDCLLSFIAFNMFFGWWKGSKLKLFSPFRKIINPIVIVYHSIENLLFVYNLL